MPFALVAQNYIGQAQIAFNQKFANVELLYEDDNDKEVSFSFYQNGDYKEATFDKYGTWLFTRSEISLTELPSAISTAIKLEYNSFTYEGIIQLDTPNKREYEVQISADEQYIILLFNDQYQIISRTVEPLETEDDNYEDYEDSEIPDEGEIDYEDGRS